MTTQYLNLHVPGLPIPQGSMRLVGGGRRMIHNKHNELMSWRASVAAHAIAEIIHTERRGQGVWPATGPCGLVVTFHIPRPKHHYRTGKFANLLRATAPREHQVKPDLDKLVRAVCDALVTACAVVDDSQICVLRAAKKWCTEPAYCSIQLEGTHHDQTRTRTPQQERPTA